MAEPIGNTDGAQKQDCEASTPSGGSLSRAMTSVSRQPTIECVRDSRYFFCFAAKPASPPYRMEWLAAYRSTP